MFFNNPKKYPTIALQELAGFSEDKDVAAHFNRRFLPLVIGNILVFLLFIFFCVLAVFQKREDNIIPQIYMLAMGTSFAASIALFYIVWHGMVNEIPTSPRSNQRMEIYQLKDTIKEGKYELIYICRQSRTYFRRVFKARGD